MTDVVHVRHVLGGSPEASDLSGLRWLARQILPLKLDVPEPWLVSDHVGRCTPLVADYVLWWIAHPDPGSRFEASTQGLRALPGLTAWRAMTELGYDGLVFPREDKIVGHVFFQRCGSAIYAFSTAVGAAWGGKGYSAVMLLDCLAYAVETPGVTRARVGTGQNNVARRLLAHLGTQQHRLGWRVGDDGWVTFSAAASAGVPPRSVAA